MPDTGSKTRQALSASGPQAQLWSRPSVGSGLGLLGDGTPTRTELCPSLGGRCSTCGSRAPPRRAVQPRPGTRPVTNVRVSRPVSPRL